jgi:hypothetical protein
MKTSEFNQRLTSAKLLENLSKHFGLSINLEDYNREQLEDFRNKLRTRMFQKEGSSGINALLTDESYQKDKAMLQLLNTRIKEMLGEDIKKLRDKLDSLEEAKKGVRAPKHTKKAKGADQTGDGKSDFDDVQVARMVAGGVPKKKAVAKATSDKFEEGRRVTGKGYDNPEHERKAPGGSVPMTSLMGRKGDDPSDEKSARRRDQEARMTALSAKGTKVAGKAQSAPQPKNPIDKDIEESDAKCNHSPKGKKCPVHGLKECGTMEAKEKPSAGMSKAEKSAVVKKAKAGGDIGKKGKGFKDVEAAAKKGGAKDPKAVAAAAMWKQQAKKESQEIFRRHVRIVNESLAYLLSENEEEKAKSITAAGDMVNDFTSWMQRVGQYQTKSMIELADKIRADFGQAEAEAFKQAVGPALSATLEMLTQQRETISNAVAALAGEQMPAEPMGMEPSADMAEPGMDAAEPDMMNTEPAGDEFAAADAAAGGEEAAGREMRESRFQRRLAESHSIISRLAK